jgi:hypothetical protein
MNFAGVTTEVMLRIHLLQQFFGHSDPTMEEDLHDIPLYREFAQLDAGITRLPDESTGTNLSIMEISSLTCAKNGESLYQFPLWQGLC